MFPIKNPYSPGAGTWPPELAGRDEIRETTRIAMERTRLCRPGKGIIMVGLRGVGKTVLLARMYEDAISDGMRAVFAEAPEGSPLPNILVPKLRSALMGMSHSEKVLRALSALVNFAKAFTVKIGDIGLELKSEPGLADNADLETDLQSLMETIGEAAKAEQNALALLVDELQYVKKTELAALCAALHRATQRRLPIIFVGAGLPQLRGQMGRAKSYAERLFDFPEIGPLPPAAARDAIAKPAQAESVAINSDALDKIVEKTRGYPYFLQEWGKHVWDEADASPITIEHVNRASESAIQTLDDGFFSVRFDRLTPNEKRYLRAMAELGDGPYRSGDIAEALQKEVTALGPARAQLINKGMAYSPAHGDIAFTVPLFGEFIRRIMPGNDWRNS